MDLYHYWQLFDATEKLLVIVVLASVLLAAFDAGLLLIVEVLPFCPRIHYNLRDRLEGLLLVQDHGVDGEVLEDIELVNVH